MKQIGIAIMSYAQDYDEHYPHYRHEVPGNTSFYWRNMVEPYIKNLQVFTCPSATGEQGYGWNYQYLGWPGSGGTSASAASAMAEVTHAAETVMVGEANYVVVGGLISSTLLTLVLVPVLYRLVEGRKEKHDLKKALKQVHTPAASAPKSIPLDDSDLPATAETAGTGASTGKSASKESTLEGGKAKDQPESGNPVSKSKLKGAKPTDSSKDPNPEFQDWTTGAIPKVRGRRAATD